MSREKTVPMKCKFCGATINWPVGLATGDELQAVYGWSASEIHKAWDGKCQGNVLIPARE